jgi:hypothetical protein
VPFSSATSSRPSVIPNERPISSLQRAVAQFLKVDKLTTASKNLGRNPGFISSAPGLLECSYYSKLEDMDLRTVFIYNFLRIINFGPEEVFFTLLYYDVYKNWQLGITTKGVPDFVMAYYDYSPERLKDPSIDSLIFAFVIKLFRFGNLPNNRENWGTRTVVDEAGVISYRLCLVDFSCSYMSDDIGKKSDFERFWREIYSNQFSRYFRHQTRNFKDVVSKISWLSSEEKLFAVLDEAFIETLTIFIAEGKDFGSIVRLRSEVDICTQFWKYCKTKGKTFLSWCE